MTTVEPMDPTVAFARLGQIRLSDTDVETVLKTVAELARRAIPGIDEVSVTLLRDGRAYTAAFTGDVALRLDESQYESGYGPCLDASAAAATIMVPDTAVERRWPRWAEQAVEHGVASSLSIGLPVGEAVTGALNLYSVRTQTFDDDALVLARTFAGYAAVALANVHMYATTAALALQLQTAMDSRAVIEQAKGVIMGERRSTAEEAFAVLVKVSRDNNHKLRDVAAAVVRNAQNPRR